MRKQTNKQKNYDWKCGLALKKKEKLLFISGLWFISRIKLCLTYCFLHITNSSNCQALYAEHQMRWHCWIRIKQLFKKVKGYGWDNFQILDGHNILTDLMRELSFNGNFNQFYKVFFLRKVTGPRIFYIQRY